MKRTIIQAKDLNKANLDPVIQSLILRAESTGQIIELSNYRVTRGKWKEKVKSLSQVTVRMLFEHLLSNKEKHYGITEILVPELHIPNELLLRIVGDSYLNQIIREREDYINGSNKELVEAVFNQELGNALQIIKEKNELSDWDVTNLISRINASVEYYEKILAALPRPGHEEDDRKVILKEMLEACDTPIDFIFKYGEEEIKNALNETITLNESKLTDKHYEMLETVLVKSNCPRNLFERYIQSSNKKIQDAILAHENTSIDDLKLRMLEIHPEIVLHKDEYSWNARE